MIGGTRQQVGNTSAYKNDPLYAFGKAFTECAQQVLTVENADLFGDPVRSMRQRNVKESLKNFFVKNFVNEADETKSAEQIEEEIEDVKEMFENDYKGIMENCVQTEYAPMVGMSLPVHKLILMNNVFAQGGGIQKVTAVQPAFTISMERRILVTPEGEEIDMFLNQNMIADAIDATAPTVVTDVALPELEATDFVGSILGGTTQDSLSVETKICGVKVANVYFAEGDILPDADGWFNPKGTEVATTATAGLKDVWFRVDLPFTPNYGGPNRIERTVAKQIQIKYKADAEGKIATINDTIFGAMNNNKLTISAAKGSITAVRVAAKLDTSNAMLDTCSVKWKMDTDYVEIPDATPINTTVSPNEVKDVSAMYDASQVTKIMSMTKTVLSEVKDAKIKRFLDESYARMDETCSGAETFDFATPEGYALDWVTHRQATFMDFLDDMVTKMLQVLNDPNMTVTIYGDPRIVRKVTPAEYTYQAPASIGAVTLDYTQTIVNTKDHRVYNFVGSDKLRNTNELMVILNPRNTERICYRIYDYQLYISNEIRKANNPSLPGIHSFERFLVKEYQPVQYRVKIANPSGQR